MNLKMKMHRPRLRRPTLRRPTWRTAQRGGMWMLLAALLAVPVMTLVMLFAGGASADGTGNFSFFEASQYYTDAFSQSQSPNPNGVTIKSMGMTDMVKNPSSGGDVLGFQSPAFGFNASWIESQFSGSSNAVSYNSLANSSNGDLAGVRSYAYFGASLSNLGLDSTSSGFTTGLVRIIAGLPIWVSFVLAAGVPLLFHAAIGFLQALNPYTWLHSAVYAINPSFANGMTGGHHVNSHLAPLADFIGKIYTWCTSMAWGIIFPVFLATFLLSILLLKNINKSTALRRVVVYAVFVGLGVPLLGSMWSGVLNDMSKVTINGDGSAEKVVLSLYTDFGSWALNDRLAIPSGASISWDATTNSAQPQSVMDVRNTSLLIDQMAHPGIFGSIQVPRVNGNAYEDWATNTVNSGSSTTAKAFFTTMNIIDQYMGQSTVSSSAWETGAKGQIGSWMTKGSGRRTKAASWFPRSGANIQNAAGAGQGSVYQKSIAPNPILSVSGTGLTSDHPGGPKEIFTSGNSGTCSTPPGEVVSSYDSKGTPLNCSLSALSMDNFLDTAFGPTSMTMYSSATATSGATIEVHNAVSQVGGSAALGLSYWLSALTTLLALAVLGWSYAIGMVIGCVKSSWNAITSIAPGMLGSISGIARVISYTIACVFELVGTLFLYEIASKALVALPDLIAQPLANVGKGGLFGSSLLGSIAVVLLTFLSIALTWVFTLAMWKLRKAILGAINEAVEALTKKLTGADPSTPSKSAGTIKPALAGAGGAALGNKLSSKSGKGPGMPLNASLPSFGGGPDGGGPGGGGPGSSAVGAGPDGGGPDGGAGSSVVGIPDGGGPNNDKELASGVTANGGLSRPAAGLWATGAVAGGTAASANSPNAAVAKGGDAARPKTLGRSQQPSADRPVGKKTLGKSGTASKGTPSARDRAKGAVGGAVSGATASAGNPVATGAGAAAGAAKGGEASPARKAARHKERVEYEKSRKGVVKGEVVPNKSKGVKGSAPTEGKAGDLKKPKDE